MQANKGEINVMGAFASWNIEFYKGMPYIADMHYPYIEYLCNNYKKVLVISSSKDVQEQPNKVNLSVHGNLKIIRLPYLPRYVDGLKHIRTIVKTLLKALKEVDAVYSRTPDPFCWIPVLLSDKRVIMDFIGDTIDCTVHNEKWGFLKKSIMIAGYIPEYILTLIAAKKSEKVVTAGNKLANNLRRYGIKAIPLVPSLLGEADIPSQLRTIQSTNKVKIVYLGYIRYAKGIYTLMEVCRLLKAKSINFELNIIGTGELSDELSSFINNNGFTNIHQLGFVESREELNNIIYNSDIFLFPSLSEGAPRVIIEAMALGTPVVSTPVGALPYLFKDKDSIRYFDFNDAEKALHIIEEFIADVKPFLSQRNKAYDLVKNNYTKESFFEQVFVL